MNSDVRCMVNIVTIERLAECGVTASPSASAIRATPLFHLTHLEFRPRHPVRVDLHPPAGRVRGQWRLSAGIETITRKPRKPARTEARMPSFVRVGSKSEVRDLSAPRLECDGDPTFSPERRQYTGEQTLNL